MNLNHSWLNQFGKKQPYLNHFLLILISFSFILSDWLYGAFTFTELILGLVVGILIILGKYRIHTHQFKWLALPIVLIGLHSIFHFMTNQEFDFRIAIIALIKLTFYLFIVIGIYNFIRVQKLEGSFLLWNNIMALIVCLLAAYIAFAVYAEMNLDRNIPYEFLLQFTRVDGHLYRRDIPIVRFKSIFEEPAHLGYYLNSVLMINLLNKVKLKSNWLFNSIIIVTGLLTLSYSAVFIMGCILILWVIKTIKVKNISLKWNYKMIFVLIGITIFIFVFRDLLYTTLIQRTSEIIAGTETSGYERLIISWRYINNETYLQGLGFMQTPGVLWNVFAYVWTEMGIMYFLFYILFILYIISLNVSVGIVFVLMNIAKGGYLSSSYWFLIILVIIYSSYNYKNVFSWFRKEEKSGNE